jgi:hypothetical protein
MKQTKLVAAIVIVAGLLIWPVGWQLYSYLSELKQFTPTEYGNYLAMGILGTYITTGIAIGYRRTPKEQTKQKHSHHGNPNPANTADIDKLVVDVAFLKERMKQVETKVTGLQTFFKPKEEAKANA